jgi:uncharacterized protein
MQTRPVALVTGATAGIGKSYVSQLARRGYDLIAVARDGARLATLAAEIGPAHGVRVTTIAADLTTDAGIAATVHGINQAARLDLLVNNAGFGTLGTLAETEMSKQEQMLTLHVVAVNRLTRAALERMVPARSGGIITVASVASFVNGTGNVNYCATKAYQRSFCEGLALEVARHNIRVQALCPGFTRSEFHQRMGDVPRLKGMSGWWWMTSDDVAAISLRQLERGGPTVCVPGWQYKSLVFLARHIPMRLREALTKRAYTRE